MKCDICSSEIEEVFLEKIKGTVIKIRKDGKIKEYHVCDKCQKEYRDEVKEKILEMQ